MIVSSTAFENNGIISLRHTGFGKDVSPELTISDVPEGTVSYAIVLDDLDVPFCKNFTHWIIWNIPVTDVIPEGLPGGPVIHKPILPVRVWHGENIDTEDLNSRFSSEKSIDMSLLFMRWIVKLIYRKILEKRVFLMRCKDTY